MSNETIIGSIQAACGILGLVGLGRYVWDTKQIQKATLAQQQAAVRPFFIFELEKNAIKTLDGATSWALIARNVGPGHALRVVPTAPNRTSFYKDVNLTVPIGEPMRLFSGDLKTIRESARLGVRVEYDDIAGQRYWTTYSPVFGKSGKLSRNVQDLRTGTIARPDALARLEILGARLNRLSQQLAAWYSRKSDSWNAV